jgi:predicted N-acetyltransferase YhbS
MLRTEDPIIQYKYLADYPSSIPTLAQWHHTQWSYLDVGVSASDRAVALGKHGKAQVPTTVVALSGDQLLGSASLIDHDMDSRMELSPWLASVYVDPPYRTRGIGSTLVRRIVVEAQALGFERLYLFTPDKERFYARLGWSVLERTNYRGYAQIVMVLHIPPQQPG